MDYLVAEIAGKQYKLIPGKSALVDFLGDVKEIECEKVLLKSSKGKLEIGQPYLKEKVKLTV